MHSGEPVFRGIAMPRDASLGGNRVLPGIRQWYRGAPVSINRRFTLTILEKEECIGLEPGLSVLREAVLAIHGSAFGRLEGDFALLPTV